MNTQSDTQSITYKPFSLQDIYRFVGSINSRDIYDLPSLKMYWRRRRLNIRFEATANGLSYD